MIMGVRFARVAIDVRAHAKTEIGIFVDHLAFGCVVIDVLLEESLVSERVLNQAANFVSARGAGVALKSIADAGGKSLEGISCAGPGSQNSSARGCP